MPQSGKYQENTYILRTSINGSTSVITQNFSTPFKSRQNVIQLIFCTWLLVNTEKSFAETMLIKDY